MANISLPPPNHAWCTTFGTAGAPLALAPQLGTLSGESTSRTTGGTRSANSSGLDHFERSPWRRRLSRTRRRGIVACADTGCGGTGGSGGVPRGSRRRAAAPTPTSSPSVRSGLWCSHSHAMPPRSRASADLRVGASEGGRKFSEGGSADFSSTKLQTNGLPQRLTSAGAEPTQPGLAG